MNPRNPMAAECIVVDGVSKAFGGVEALRAVTFESRAHRITGIIGPNGAGKSTLFNVITGVLEPDAGVVTIGGVDVRGLRPEQVAERGVGRTFQTARGFPSLSILENLTVAPTDGAQGMWASLIGRPRRPGIDARAGEILARIGLREKASAPFTGLSAGERRLLEIGRQLTREPKYMLLDEPTAGVAPAFQERLVSLMRSLRDEGKVLICVEHNMGFLRQVADEIVVLVQGQVAASGPTAEVLQDPRVIEAYLGKGSASVRD